MATPYSKLAKTSALMVPPAPRPTSKIVMGWPIDLHAPQRKDGTGADVTKDTTEWELTGFPLKRVGLGLADESSGVHMF